MGYIILFIPGIGEVAELAVGVVALVGFIAAFGICGYDVGTDYFTARNNWRKDLADAKKDLADSDVAWNSARTQFISEIELCGNCPNP